MACRQNIQYNIINRYHPIPPVVVGGEAYIRTTPIPVVAPAQALYPIHIYPQAGGGGGTITVINIPEHKMGANGTKSHKPPFIN